MVKEKWIHPWWEGFCGGHGRSLGNDSWKVVLGCSEALRGMGCSVGWTWLKPRPRAKVNEGSVKKDEVHVGNCGILPLGNQGNNPSKGQGGRAVVVSRWGSGCLELSRLRMLSRWTSLGSMHWFNRIKEHLLFCSHSFRPWSLKMNQTFSCSQRAYNRVKYVDVWTDVFSKVLE